MAATVGTKLATMKKDCEEIVTELNRQGAYRSAAQVQGLLTQVDAVQLRVQQDEVATPPVAGG